MVSGWVGGWELSWVGWLGWVGARCGSRPPAAAILLLSAAFVDLLAINMAACQNRLRNLGPGVVSACHTCHLALLSGVVNACPTCRLELVPAGESLPFEEPAAGPLPTDRYKWLTMAQVSASDSFPASCPLLPKTAAAVAVRWQQAHACEQGAVLRTAPVGVACCTTQACGCVLAGD